MISPVVPGRPTSEVLAWLAGHGWSSGRDIGEEASELVEVRVAQLEKDYGDLKKDAGNVRDAGNETTGAVRRTLPGRNVLRSAWRYVHPGGNAVIASTPVARWVWGRDETADALVCSLRDLLAAYQVLEVHRFAVGAPTVHISVSEAGASNSLLFKGELAVPAGAHPVPQLAEQVRAGLRPGEIGSVDAYVECAGMVVTGADAKEARHDALFRLGASSFADFVTVDLVMYTDVWLPYDLKGRPQPEVHAANGPRLSRALRELAEALESETDPDDPTYFAKPTATGAENFFAADGTATDVWGSFEVPTRYDVFTHAPGFGRIGYRRTVEGEVQYVPVLDGRGEVLGFLWASDAEKAASFEPREAGDDATYRAGLIWLDRLRTAHDRGLSPSAALAELSALADADGAGHADPTAQPRTVPLSTLRGPNTGQ